MQAALSGPAARAPGLLALRPFAWSAGLSCSCTSCTGPGLLCSAPGNAGVHCCPAGQGMAFWAFNGVGLGLLLPNAQSLIADYFSGACTPPGTAQAAAQRALPGCTCSCCA